MRIQLWSNAITRLADDLEYNEPGFIIETSPEILSIHDHCIFSEDGEPLVMLPWRD